MGLLVCLHLYCNFRAVKSLRLRKMNEERLLLTVKGYLYSARTYVPSVAEVNLEESVILGFGCSARSLCGFSVKLGKGEILNGAIPNANYC